MLLAERIFNPTDHILKKNSYFLIHKEFLGLSLNHNQASILSLFLYYSENSSPHYLLEEKNNIRDNQEKKLFGWIEKSVNQIHAQLFENKSRTSTVRYLKSLENQGWLESCPSEAHKQGKQYRVNLKQILTALAKHPDLLLSLCKKKNISEHNFTNPESFSNLTNFSRDYNKYLSAHESLISLTGSLEKGLLLSYFLQRANHLKDRKEYINEEHGNYKSIIGSKDYYGWIDQSQENIKKAIGLKVHQPRMTILLNDLVKKGWIKKIERRKIRKNNLYRVNLFQIMHDLQNEKLNHLTLENSFSMVKEFCEKSGIKKQSILREKPFINMNEKPYKYTQIISSTNIEGNDNKIGSAAPQREKSCSTEAPFFPFSSSKNFILNSEIAVNHALTTYSWEKEFIEGEYEKFQNYYNALGEPKKANSEVFWKKWCEKVRKSDITRWEEKREYTQNYETKETSSVVNLKTKGWGILTNFTDALEKKCTTSSFNAFSFSITEVTKEDYGYYTEFNITTDNSFPLEISQEDWLNFARDLARKYQKPIKLILHNFGPESKIIFSEFEEAAKAWGVQREGIESTFGNKQEEFCNFTQGITKVETYTLPLEGKKQLVKPNFYTNLQSSSLVPDVYENLPDGSTILIEVKVRDLKQNCFSDCIWEEFMLKVSKKHKTKYFYEMIFVDNEGETKSISLANNISSETSLLA